MIKIDKEDIKVDGDFETIILELMNLNIQIANKVVENKLKDSGVDEVSDKDINDMSIKFLNKIFNGCVNFINDKEILK